MMEPSAVTNFREYLKVKSVQPNPDYDGCVELLKRLYSGLDVSVSQRELVQGKPILMFTKYGTDRSLTSILINSHMDVVPVTQSKWKHDPFSGEKTTDGEIYGRGSQDMKCVGIQAMEALSRLNDKQLLRTVHVSFVPDEEIGGEDGMKAWVKTDEFKSLNIGFAIDESAVTPLPIYIVFNAERSAFTAEVTLRGKSGHGSMFCEDPASDKLTKLLQSVSLFSNTELLKYTENKMGNWPHNTTTINLTMIHGGSHHNVVPDEIKVTYDCRLAPTLDFDQFKQWFREICKDAGSGVNVTFKEAPKWPVSPTDDSCPFWKAFVQTTEAMDVAVLPVTCPGTTDARFLRQVGIPAYGFTPMNETPTLLHDHNEFVYEDQFMKGIDIYVKVIESVASVKPF